MPAYFIQKTRLGHYHVPAGEGKGYEHTALVVGVNPDGTLGLAIWQEDGEPYRRERVPVTGSAAYKEGASFHLTADCPFDKLTDF